MPYLTEAKNNGHSYLRHNELKINNKAYGIKGIEQERQEVPDVNRLAYGQRRTTER